MQSLAAASHTERHDDNVDNVDDVADGVSAYVDEIIQEAAQKVANERAQRKAFDQGVIKGEQLAQVKLQKMRKKYDTQTHLLEELNKANSRLQNEITALQREKAELQEEKDRLGLLQQQFESLKSAFSDTKIITDQSEQIETLQAQLNDKTAKITNLQAQLTEKVAALESARDQIERLLSPEAMQAQLGLRSEEMQRTIQDLNKELALEKASVLSLSSSMADQGKEIKTLQVQLAEKTAAITRLDAQVNETLRAASIQKEQQLNKTFEEIKAQMTQTKPVERFV